MCTVEVIKCRSAIDLEMLFSADDNPDPRPSSGPTALAAALVVTYQPNSVEYYSIPVPIDVVCMLSLTTPFQSVYDLISEGISSQEQIQKYVLWKIRVSNSLVISNSLHSENSLHTVMKCIIY